MEFGLSQDQLLLDDSLRKYLSTEVSLESVRKVVASHISDNDMWRGLADMGLAGIVIPEAHGGAELGMLDAVAVAGALGYAACPVPFQHCDHGCTLTQAGRGNGSTRRYGEG